MPRTTTRGSTQDLFRNLFRALSLERESVGVGARVKTRSRLTGTGTKIGVNIVPGTGTDLLSPTGSLISRILGDVQGRRDAATSTSSNTFEVLWRSRFHSRIR